MMRLKPSRSIPLLAVLLAGLLSLLPAQAAVVLIAVTENLDQDSSWTRLQWVEQGNGRRAWIGTDLLPSPGVNDVFEITVPDGFVGLVDVTDVGTPDDQYQVLDFGSEMVLGTMSAPSGNGGSDLSPSATFLDADFSSGTVAFLAGTHDFHVDLVADPAPNTGGGVYIRLRTTPIPEPSTAGLMLVAGALLASVRRRRFWRT